MEKQDGKTEMSAIAAEMHRSIVAIAGERSWSETRESWLSRAAHACGISYRSAKSLFYQEITDPKSSIVEKVRAAVARGNRDADEISIAELRNQMAVLMGRLAQLDTAHAVEATETFGRAPDAGRAAPTGPSRGD